jgi:HK97 family phage portal protein
MSILGTVRTLMARATTALSGLARGGWMIVREPFTGAWQQNAAIPLDTVLSYWAVFACVTLIASDIAKLRLRLVAIDDEGIWTETTNPAFSPVLRKPNRYQTIIKFVETWIVSKLVHGNTYVLKQRDGRGVVVALYVLDPTRVTPLVATDGSVYYQLGRDELAGVVDGTSKDPVVPAREIIHDAMVPLYHPLIGVSPIYACGIAALQGLKIQQNSLNFFASGSQPGGILTAPGAINDETAARLSKYWNENFTGDNVGKVAVVGDGLKYEGLSVNAVDAQLVDQLRLTAETICGAFHVPLFMVDTSKAPPYANTEPLVQQYYNQCIQSLTANFETCLDEGLELPAPYGTEFDVDDLIWMDTGTRTKAATDSIGSGGMSPDEARKKYFGLGTVKGGDTPYMQQQMYSLAALAQRDASDPFAKPALAPPPAPTPIPSGEQVKHIDVVVAALLERALQAAA